MVAYPVKLVTKQFFQAYEDENTSQSRVGPDRDNVGAPRVSSPHPDFIDGAPHNNRNQLANIPLIFPRCKVNGNPGRKNRTTAVTAG